MKFIETSNFIWNNFINNFNYEQENESNNIYLNRLIKL